MSPPGAPELLVKRLSAKLRSEIDRFVTCGWLLKSPISSRSGRHQLRYFMLKRRMLSYFVESYDAEMKGQVNLKLLKSVDKHESREHGEHGLKLIVASEEKKADITLFLYAKTGEDIERWLYSINECI